MLFVSAGLSRLKKYRFRISGDSEPCYTIQDGFMHDQKMTGFELDRDGYMDTKTALRNV